MDGDNPYISKYLKWPLCGFKLNFTAFSHTDSALLLISVALGPPLFSLYLHMTERGLCLNLMPFYTNSFKHLSSYRLYYGLHEVLSSSCMRTALRRYLASRAPFSIEGPLPAIDVLICKFSNAVYLEI